MLETAMGAAALADAARNRYDKLVINKDMMNERPWVTGSTLSKTQWVQTTVTI